MAGQTYQVNYIVNVDTTTAQSAINSFKTAVASMNKATRPLNDVQRQVRGLMQTLGALNRSNNVIKIDTSPATKKIGKLIRGLHMVKAEIQQINTMRITTGGVVAPKSNKGTTLPVATSSSKSGSTVTNRSLRSAMANQAAINNSNYGYKLFGPARLPDKGGMAVDMLKGMGIAYGIAGIGSLISNITNQAVEYDNLMKTVENILKSHDAKDNFRGRYASMVKKVRYVGMKTKFKITEVADASRFLAMAGLDVDAIQQAISPIADIALVGDTDLGQTADLVTNVMTAYNIKPQKMRHSADVMTNTFTMSNTTLTEIAESYKYAASLLSAADIPFEEATAAIGVLGNAGIKGSQAGTTMRTIVANLANPTKKQQKAWDAIGISLRDSLGKRKDIMQIFQELHDADLDVGEYYKLFHKTAASGAVSLAKYVDVWDTIYQENMLSDGLARRLAEEKQNTLQGLWKQLESVIVDQGVTAFNGVQGGLRSWMQQAIDWIHPEKNPNAQNVFKNVANNIMEFMRVLIDAGKWFAWFFDQFGWFIKMWAKFQLMIWPVVKAVTAFRVVFTGLLGLRKVGLILTSWTTGFKRLGSAAVGAATAVNSANAAVKTGNMTPFGFTAGYGQLPGLTHKQYIKAARGLNLSRPHYSDFSHLSPIEADAARTIAMNQYRQDRKIFNRRVFRQQLRQSGAHMGFGAGAALGGMALMTQENANGYDAAAGGLLMAAGSLAMVPGIGWVGAGIATGFAALFEALASGQRLNELDNYLNSFAQSHRTLDGVILNSKNQTERYLEFVYRKNYDINDLIARRTELMEYLLGLESTPPATSEGMDNTVFKEMYGAFRDADNLLNDVDTIAWEAAKKFNEDFGQYGFRLGTDSKLGSYDGGAYVTMPNGQKIYYNDPDGALTGRADAMLYDIAAANEYVHGKYATAVREENAKRLNNFLYSPKSSVEDIKRWKETFDKENNPDKMKGLITPDKWNVEYDEAERWTGKEIHQSYLGAWLNWTMVKPLREAQDAIINFKEKQKAGTLELIDVVNGLRFGDANILGQTLANFNPNDVLGWFNSLGYRNGQWYDPEGRRTPEEMAQIGAGHAEKLREAIHRLGLEADPAAKPLLDLANILTALAGIAGASGDAINGSQDGEIKTVEGQKWRWDAATQKWVLLDDNNKPAEISQGLIDLTKNINNFGSAVKNINNNWPVTFPIFGQTNNGQTFIPDSTKPYTWSDGTETNSVVIGDANTASTATPPWFSWMQAQAGWTLRTPAIEHTKKQLTVTPEAMGNMVAAEKEKKKDDKKDKSELNGGDGSGSGSGYGTRTSDYKSHSKERAVPKQININIQNLMNVDSIDLTKADNVEVIDRMKREVAYALVEAASDGVMMLNNLTT